MDAVDGVVVLGGEVGVAVDEGGVAVGAQEVVGGAGVEVPSGSVGQGWLWPVWRFRFAGVARRRWLCVRRVVWRGRRCATLDRAPACGRTGSRCRRCTAGRRAKGRIAKWAARV